MNLSLSVGETKAPTVNKSPSNTAWANASDFTYSFSSSGCVSVDGYTGKFTGKKVGMITVTATHKVTNRTATFLITVVSTDPFHPTNIEYVRYVRITGKNWWGLGGDTDHTLGVVKSKLYSDPYFIVRDNLSDNYTREYVISNDLKNTLNNLEQEYQNHNYFTRTDEENAAHSAKVETDQMIDSGYFSKESTEYYGVWAYNYTSTLNLGNYWRGIIDTASKAYAVYLAATSFYYSYLSTRATTSCTVYTSEYKEFSSALDKVDDALSGVKYTKRIVISAEERNAAISGNYSNPPYKPGTPVVGFNTSESTQFVRVYGNGTNSVGKWIMRYSDIKGLTAAQIQEKFALPNLPTHYCYVNVPTGNTIYTGIVNENFGYAGEAIQFELGQAIDESCFGAGIALP